jgi:sigma-B regulation protein RsbU (phosphoserine phosphatase)
MHGIFHKAEFYVFKLFRRQRPSGRLWRWCFWSAIVWCLAVAFEQVSVVSSLAQILSFLSGLIFFVCGLPLLVRWLFSTVLWKVRNRLIVTYLLMALAPVVLFGTLAFMAAYLFSGQFAIFSTTSRVEEELSHLESQNRGFLSHVSQAITANPALRNITIPEYSDSLKDTSHPGLEVDAFVDGKPLTVANAPARAPITLPAWAGNHYRGVVFSDKGLTLRALDQRRAGAHTVTLVTTLPLSQQVVERLAEGLGRLSILPARDLADAAAKAQQERPKHFTLNIGKPEKKSGVEVNGKNIEDEESPIAGLRGGSIPPQKHFYDVPVSFLGQLKTTDWEDGKQDDSTLVVYSRPTMLAEMLFNTSLQTADIVRKIFIGIAIFFGILELIAFLMAVRLNQTITQSVHSLYEATKQIDSGNLRHRIEVRRKDQLAALGHSFNGMANSMERLLAEQREMHRLENELAIAQEVQNNLFPHDILTLPMLELHGCCRPARTVSGDYYDFLLFSGHSLGLAIGDISGKGISAALLMASLHSAVRAYRFADGSDDTDGEDNGEWFSHPALLLTRLNRHLYQSTQPEKYATLFLAHYNSSTSELTYSNGGQLPPLLLRESGKIDRLDCGGPVVGLLSGMSFEQKSLKLKSGDILVAYSDGVTEPENEFGDFGEERLVEIVQANRNLPLETISERVLAAITDWIGPNEQPDDITLVLARQR